MTRLPLTVIVLNCLLLLSGCAGVTQLYPGERRPDHEVAVIREAYPIGTSKVSVCLACHTVFITNLDGRNTSFWSDVTYPNSYSVLPGHHVLKLVHVGPFSGPRCATIEMEAEAGITYLVREIYHEPDLFEFSALSVFVQNAKTGRWVASSEFKKVKNVSFFASLCP